MPAKNANTSHQNVDHMSLRVSDPIISMAINKFNTRRIIQIDVVAVVLGGISFISRQFAMRKSHEAGMIGGR